MELSGQIALVTEAGQGIGEAIALALAREGAAAAAAKGARGLAPRAHRVGGVWSGAAVRDINPLVVRGEGRGALAVDTLVLLDTETRP